MFKINENYLKLPGSYLFSAIAKKVAAYEEANPDKQVIRLGIGDVTLPIAPAIVEAIHKAADEMGQARTFHGYAPDLGYAFLRETIVEKDYRLWGCHVEADEIFISDGAKSDCGNIQEIFSEDAVIAVCDPVRFTWIPTSWPAEPGSMMRRRENGAESFTCRARRKTSLSRRSRRRLPI